VRAVVSHSVSAVTVVRVSVWSSQRKIITINGNDIGNGNGNGNNDNFIATDTTNMSLNCEDCGVCVPLWSAVRAVRCGEDRSIITVQLNSPSPLNQE